MSLFFFFFIYIALIIAFIVHIPPPTAVVALSNTFVPESETFNVIAPVPDPMSCVLVSLYSRLVPFHIATIVPALVLKPL